MIVLHHVVNQPHTPSPHFSSLPNELLGYFLVVLFWLHSHNIIYHPFHPVLVCPSSDFPPSISLLQKPAYGAPTPHLFFNQLVPSSGQSILHWGTHFCICIIIPTKFLILFIIKPLFPTFYIAFCHHLWQPSSFLENETHVALSCGIPYHLLFLTSSIYSEYPIGHLPLLSEFVHFVPPLAQLIPCLVVPLTLDLVERLQTLIPHIYPQPRAVLSLHASWLHPCTSSVLDLTQWISRSPLLLGITSPFFSTST